MTTDQDILGDDDLSSLELGDGDDSIGQLLLKIDFLQSEVGKLKSKYESITRENAERISLAEKLQFSPPRSENGIEETYVPSQSTGMAVPQTGETSYVEVPVTSGSIDPASLESCKTVSSLHNVFVFILAAGGVYYSCYEGRIVQLAQIHLLLHQLPQHFLLPRQSDETEARNP